jgi:hypothetical protein
MMDSYPSLFTNMKTQGWVLPAAASLARAALKLVIAGCIGLFNYYAFGWLLPAFEVQVAALYANWGLDYPYSGVHNGGEHMHAMLPPHLPALQCLGMGSAFLAVGVMRTLLLYHAGSLGAQTMDPYDTTVVAFLWLPVLVAALATYLLIAIPHGTGVCVRDLVCSACIAYA